jgi:hypothetical protein
MFDRYPIHIVIENLRRELGLRPSELAQRCRFKNIAKGIRRIDSVCCGDLDSESAKMVLEALPKALVIEKAVVEKAIHETAEIIAEAERKAAADREAAYRASFQPHNYLLGTDERPSQITIYGLTGGPDRWRKIRFDFLQPPETFAGQALAVAQKTPIVQYHGPTTGFIVNYTPDNAVRFDLDGNEIDRLERAFRPGDVRLLIGKRELLAGFGFR